MKANLFCFLYLRLYYYIEDRFYSKITVGSMCKILTKQGDLKSRLSGNRKAGKVTRDF